MHHFVIPLWSFDSVLIGYENKTFIFHVYLFRQHVLGKERVSQWYIIETWTFFFIWTHLLDYSMLIVAAVIWCGCWEDWFDLKNSCMSLLTGRFLSTQQWLIKRQTNMANPDRPVQNIAFARKNDSTKLLSLLFLYCNSEMVKSPSVQELSLV